MSSLTRATPYLAFFLTGIITTLLGPILPWLTARWSLTDREAGVFFTAQFTTSLAAGVASSLVAARVGERRTIAMGLSCMAIGATAVAIGPAGVALGGISVCGLGMGLTVPTTNILVARLFRENASAALSAVNLAWGAGAALWPLIIAASGSPGTAVLVLGLTLATAAAFCLGPELPPDRVPDRSFSNQATAWWPWLFFGTFFFLYGGVEAAVGGWVTELARRLDPAASAALSAAAFWGGLTGGRAVVALLVSQAHESRTALGGATLAIIAIAALLVARDAPTVGLSAVLAGLGLAPLFPITVAVLSRGRFRVGAGPLISLSGVGGATIPWLVGAASTWGGSLQLALLVPFAGCLLIGGLQASFWVGRRGEGAL